MSSGKGKQTASASTEKESNKMTCSICKTVYDTMDDLTAHRNATHSLAKQQVHKHRNTNAEGNNKGVARNAGAPSSGSASGGGKGK